jgi:hypothetical protein
LTAFCCALMAGCVSRTPAPESGVELYAVPPENVREILFSSPDRKLFAYRWGQEGPFQIWTASKDSGEPERCTGGEPFKKWLEAVSSMRVERSASSSEAGAAAGWSDLLIRDYTSLDPIQIRLRIPASEKEPVVADWHGSRVVVRIDARVLRTALSGCAQLSLS